MKAIKLFSVLAFAFIFGCSGDTGGSTTLAGQWNLTSVKGGITGSDDSFTQGTIVWNFDSTANTVEVTNNNTDSTKQDMLPSGTYTYSIQQNTTNPDLCSQVFVIDEVDFGCYHITSHHLTIGQQEADGYLITLVR